MTMAPKPLPFIHSFRNRHGTLVHYFRKRGCKIVRLRGLPGSPELMRAYEAALVREITPATGAQHCVIHFGVEGAQAGDVERILATGVETVVGLGQTLVPTDHQLRAEGVIRLAGCFKGGIGLKALREWERPEAVGGRVAQPIL
jgi:hypothetical protein